MTKRIITSLVLASLLFAGSSSVAFARGGVATRDVVESLGAMGADQNSQMGEFHAELKLMKRLRKGDKGDEVKILQQILATNPDIYPEGKITGIFGPMTARALRRFQEKEGLEGIGEAGPKTLALLNKFLSQGGAGNSGRVPEGLLRNTGGVITVPLVMQNDSGLQGSAVIVDNADGKAVVRIKLKTGDNDMMMRPMESNEGEGGEMHMWKDMSTSTYPAHIHLGACPTPGAVVYPLTSIVDGTSETVLATSTKALIGGLPLAINVHKSATELATFVACGDLKASDSPWKMGDR